MVESKESIHAVMQCFINLGTSGVRIPLLPQKIIAPGKRVRQYAPAAKRQGEGPKNDDGRSRTADAETEGDNEK